MYHALSTCSFQVYKQKISLPYYLFPGLRDNGKIMKSADSLYLTNVHVNVCQTRDNIVMSDANG